MNQYLPDSSLDGVKEVRALRGFTDHVVRVREALLLYNTVVVLNLRQHIRIGAAGKIVTAF